MDDRTYLVDGGVGRGTMSECDAMAWGCCSSQSKRERERERSGRSSRQ